MKQLGAMGREVEEQSFGGKAPGIAEVILGTEPVTEPPAGRGGEWGVDVDATLSAMGREVDGHEIEVGRVRLPADDDEGVGGGIIGPGAFRFQERGLATTHG